MMNIVIPMAGAGSRFVNEGYIDPKPLIKIYGFPMIQVVINNLRPSQEHQFIFICQKVHLDKYRLKDQLLEWAPRSEIIALNGITEGAACSVLMVEKFIDNSHPLMIANSDQFIDHDIDAYLEHLNNSDLDGLIMTMEANDPKWSFVGLDKNNFVERVVEKEVISNQATVGIYNFSRGSDFVAAAKAMIDKNLRVNGEFYIAPSYNELINKGKRIGSYNIGSENNGMYGLGTPVDLDLFLKKNIHFKAIKGL